MAVEDALKSDSTLLMLREKYIQAQARERKARGMAAGPGDLAWVETKRALEAIKKQYNELVARKRPQIQKQMQLMMAGDGERLVRDAQDQVEKLTARQDMLKKKLAELKIESREAVKAADRDNLDIKLGEQELNYIHGIMEQVQRSLQATELDAQVNTNKVHTTLAFISRQYTTNNGPKLMMAAPGRCCWRCWGCS